MDRRSSCCSCRCSATARCSTPIAPSCSSCSPSARPRSRRNGCPTACRSATATRCPRETSSRRSWKAPVDCRRLGAATRAGTGCGWLAPAGNHRFRVPHRRAARRRLPTAAGVRVNSQMNRLVVVGNGMAGVACVEQILQARARLRHHDLRRRDPRQLQPHPAVVGPRRRKDRRRHRAQRYRLVPAERHPARARRPRHRRRPGRARP